MHLLFTGGGTAGHVIPNVALIELLQDKTKIKVSYIGSKHGPEQKILLPYNILFYPIQTGKLRRYFSWENFVDLFRVPIGIIQSLLILHKSKPNLVFSKGGYVALPVVIAARILNIPTIVHESDSIMGLTTKITAQFATQFWGAYNLLNLPPKLQSKFKQVFLPIRSDLLKGDKSFYQKQFKSSNKPVLLVMGGSQGAQVINELIHENLTTLLETYNILHICGKNNIQPELKHPDYIQIEYISDHMNHAYAAADVVVSRAGASSLSELSALNKKTILIPLPTHASRGEQIINAKEFVQNNPAVLINQSELSLTSLQDSIKKLNNLQSVANKTKSNTSTDFSIQLLLDLASK